MMEGCPCVAFDLLPEEEGWQSGLPPLHLSSAYIQQLNKAVDILHAAQVAHMDLLPSNILWRPSPAAPHRDVELRIIDFEDAVPYGAAIDNIEELRKDFRYPVSFDDPRKTISASQEHNTWFLDAITRWVEARTFSSFTDFMSP